MNPSAYTGIALVGTLFGLHSPTQVFQSRYQAERTLFEICAQSAHEVVGSSRLFVRCSAVPAENVIPNVPFDHLGHERIHGPTASSDVVQDVRTFRLLIERLLNRSNLSHDSMDPMEQLLLFLNSVCHKRIFTRIIAERSLQAYPGGYSMSIESRSRLSQVSRERRPMLSDGGNSRLREQIDTDSAEPRSLTVPSL